ncbi:hypothetical protein V8E53_014977, partial [Lactarius tabidus]
MPSLGHLAQALVFSPANVVFAGFGILLLAAKDVAASQDILVVIFGRIEEKFVKRIAGRTDLEDGLKKLDTLTNEEVVMAMAQLLKITHNIDNKVTGVGDGIRDIDDRVQ